MRSHKKDSLISIVMPVKNADLYLEECLRSIIDQTEINWELIAVNDHSSDSSMEILKKYSSFENRINVLDNNGIGIIEALRLAYQKSYGNFITRMDADDIMMPHKLQILKTNLIDNGEGNVSIGGVKYFSSGLLGNGYQQYEKWLNNLTANGINFTEIYKECVIPSPSWMMYKNDFERCGSFDSDIYPEDYDLCFRMYRERVKELRCQEIVHYWRDHSARSSRNLLEYSDNSFLELKVKYFIELDYDKEKQLILWGAGKKGKNVASNLKARAISFRWVCNNENKIGKDISGIKMESPDDISLDKEYQILILVANKRDQSEIKKHPLSSYCKTDVYFFC